ncbi:hypothetical protein [Luteimonas salinisoli]|nr:hypothetical protein [Luteimonas salinisoli]
MPALPVRPAPTLPPRRGNAARATITTTGTGRTGTGVRTRVSIA